MSFLVRLIHFIGDAFELNYIKSILKTSLMGHVFDNTLEYYFNRLIVSPTDLEYRIEYECHGDTYACICEPEYYDECMSYINTLLESGLLLPQSKVVLAFSVDESGVKDITKDIKKLQGIKKDFYKNTEFHVKVPEGNTFYILDTNARLFRFSQGEFIDLSISTKTKSIDVLNRFN